MDTRPDEMTPWFRLKENDPQLAPTVWSAVDAIESQRAATIERWKDWAGLYLDEDVSSFAPHEWRQSPETPAPPGLKMGHQTYNLVRACVDTLAARLSMHLPEVRYQLSGASELMQQRMTLLQRYVLCVLDENDAEGQMRRAIKNAAIYGLGVLYTYASGGRVRVESIHPERILYDISSAMRSSLPELFYRDYWGRWELIDAFPDLEKEIIKLTAEQSSGGLIQVADAYRVAHGDRKGRRTLCARGLLLYDGPWESESTPFTFIAPETDGMGFLPISQVSSIENIQQALKYIFDRLMGNARHLATAFLFKRANAQIEDQDILSNEEYKVLEGLEEPKVQHPPVAHEQFFRLTDQLWDKGFAQFGQSQMTATSIKPAGLRSAAAIEAHAATETQRFASFEKTIDRASLDLGRQIPRCSRKLFGARKPKKEADPSLVDAPGTARSFVDLIDWSLTDIDDDRFVVSLAPASPLPRQPAGRLERIMELAANSAMPPEWTAQLLRDLLPDLSKELELQNAPRDLFEADFEHMLVKGEYLPPHDKMALQVGIELAVYYWARARRTKVDEQHTDLLLRWIDDADRLLKGEPAVPPEPPMPPEGAMAPPAGLQMAGEPGSIPPPMLPSGIGATVLGV